MTTQFIVRSESNAYPLKLRTILYDGLGLRRTTENGIPVFEINDSDVVIELVIRRSFDSDAGGSSSNNNASAEKESSAVSAAREEAADKPGAKPAEHPTKKISSIARSIEPGSEIQVSCHAISCNVVLLSRPFILSSSIDLLLLYYLTPTCVML